MPKSNLIIEVGSDDDQTDRANWRGRFRQWIKGGLLLLFLALFVLLVRQKSVWKYFGFGRRTKRKQLAFSQSSSVEDFDVDVRDVATDEVSDATVFREEASASDSLLWIESSDGSVDGIDIASSTPIILGSRSLDPDDDHHSLTTLSYQGFEPDGGSFVIYTWTGTSQSDPLVISLPEGEFMALWNRFQYGSLQRRVMAQIFGSDGVETGDQLSLIDAHYGHFSAVVLSDGDGFVLFWANGSDEVVGQMFGFSATTASLRFTVFSSVGSKYFEVTTASLTGSRYITIGSEFHYDAAAGTDVCLDIYAQVFSNPYTQQGAVRNIGGCSGRGSSLRYKGGVVVAGLQDGGFVVAMEVYKNNSDRDDWGVFVCLYNEVAEGQGYLNVAENTAGNQYNPSLIVLENGNFFVGWCDGGKILGRLFASSGSALSGSIVLRDHERSIDVFALSSVSTGGFLLSWLEGASYEKKVYGQLRDKKGKSSGAEFNVAKEGHTQSVSVSVQDDDTVFMAWDEIGRRSSDPANLYGRIYYHVASDSLEDPLLSSEAIGAIVGSTVGGVCLLSVCCVTGVLFSKRREKLAARESERRRQLEGEERRKRIQRRAEEISAISIAEEAERRRIAEERRKRVVEEARKRSIAEEREKQRKVAEEAERRRIAKEKQDRATKRAQGLVKQLSVFRMKLGRVISAGHEVRLKKRLTEMCLSGEFDRLVGEHVRCGKRPAIAKQIVIRLEELKLDGVFEKKKKAKKVARSEVKGTLFARGSASDAVEAKIESLRRSGDYDRLMRKYIAAGKSTQQAQEILRRLAEKMAGVKKQLTPAQRRRLDDLKAKRERLIAQARREKERKRAAIIAAREKRARLLAEIKKFRAEQRKERQQLMMYFRACSMQRNLEGALGVARMLFVKENIWMNEEIEKGVKEEIARRYHQRYIVKAGYRVGRAQNALDRRDASITMAIADDIGDGDMDGGDGDVDGGDEADIVEDMAAPEDTGGAGCGSVDMMDDVPETDFTDLPEVVEVEQEFEEVDLDYEVDAEIDAEVEVEIEADIEAEMEAMGEEFVDEEEFIARDDASTGGGGDGWGMSDYQAEELIGDAADASARGDEDVMDDDYSHEISLPGAVEQGYEMPEYIPYDGSGARVLDA